MSRYHVATLKGEDRNGGRWQARLDWTCGLCVDQILLDQQPLGICFSLKGTYLEEKALEKASWLPGIESSRLIGYFHVHESKTQFYKAFFFIQVCEQGLKLGLEYDSSQLDQIGWKIQGPLMPQEKIASRNLPRTIGLIASKYSLLCLQGEPLLKEEAGALKLLCSQKKKAQVTLMIGGCNS